jgi:hypothetical protein
MGCHGTSALLKSVLMSALIPVVNGNSSISDDSHAIPYFISENAFLDHGDTPYSWLATAEPRYPMEQLLLPAIAPGSLLFVTASIEGLPVAILQDYARPHSTVEKRLSDLAIASPPAVMVRRYCYDRALGYAHADGYVYKSYFSSNYDVSQLEQLGLYNKLEQLLAPYGTCAQVPVSPNTSAQGGGYGG